VTEHSEFEEDYGQSAALPNMFDFWYNVTSSLASRATGVYIA